MNTNRLEANDLNSATAIRSRRINLADQLDTEARRLEKVGDNRQAVMVWDVLAEELELLGWDTDATDARTRARRLEGAADAKATAEATEAAAKAEQKKVAAERIASRKGRAPGISGVMQDARLYESEGAPLIEAFGKRLSVLVHRSKVGRPSAEFVGPRGGQFANVYALGAEVDGCSVYWLKQNSSYGYDEVGYLVTVHGNTAAARKVTRAELAQADGLARAGLACMPCLLGQLTSEQAELFAQLLADSGLPARSIGTVVPDFMEAARLTLPADEAPATPVTEETSAAVELDAEAAWAARVAEMEAEMTWQMAAGLASW